MASTLRITVGIFLVTLAVEKLQWASGYDAIFQRAYIEGPERLPGIYQLRKFAVHKFNRTTSIVNLDVELETDLGNDFSVQYDFYYSRLGDSNFIKSPIHIEKMSVCEFFDKFRSKEMMQDILAVSNIPKGFPCPLPKGKYWVKDYLLDPNKCISWAPEGLWRVEALYFDKNGTMFVKFYSLVRVKNGVN